MQLATTAVEANQLYHAALENPALTGDPPWTHGGFPMVMLTGYPGFRIEQPAESVPLIHCSWTLCWQGNETCRFATPFICHQGWALFLWQWNYMMMMFMSISSILLTLSPCDSPRHPDTTCDSWATLRLIAARPSRISPRSRPPAGPAFLMIQLVIQHG